MNDHRLFADECCPRSLVLELRRLGLDVRWAIEDGPGLDDRVQAQRAFNDQRIVVTADYDFAELAVRGVEAFVGLIMLAPDLEIEGDAAVALAVRIRTEVSRAVGRVLILEAGRMRERPL